MLAPADVSHGDVHGAAARGISGSGSALPDQATIQRSFGGYDISNVQAHTDAAAANAAASMGASAFATGHHVVLGAGGRDLHTQAHEAAHVVQQRAGVSLSGGIGKAGDAYEQHADRVADAVVQGKSAEGILGEMADGGGGGTGAGIQCKPSDPEQQTLGTKQTERTNTSERSEDEATPAGVGWGGVQMQQLPSVVQLDEATDAVHAEASRECVPGASQETRAVTVAELEKQRQIDRVFNQAKDSLNIAFCLERQSAVEQLRSDLERADEPSLATTLFTAAAMAALSAATAGVGTAIAAAMTSRGVAKVAADAIKRFVEGRLNAGATAAAGMAVPTGNTRPKLGAFIATQSVALGNVAQDVLHATEEQRCQFYAADDGLPQAEQLRDGAMAGRSSARGEQYRASLAEWSELLNRGSRLTARDQRTMDTTAPGILGIDIDIPTPSSPMRVEGASLEGIPEPAREGLRRESAAGATIGDITPPGGGMTVRAIQSGQAPGLFGSASSARVRIPLESTPQRRNNPMPTVTTGGGGMFLIERIRSNVYGTPSPDFASLGPGRAYDYAQTPIAAAIVWARDIAPLPIRSLPAIGG